MNKDKEKLKAIKKGNDDKDIKVFLKTLKKQVKKLPVVNNHLRKRLDKIVTKLVAMEARDEASEILFNSDAKMIGSFLYYYYSDSGNVACMVLDEAKKILVESGILNQWKTDHFGEHKLPRRNDKGKK
jgi:hypothetical protein